MRVRAGARRRVRSARRLAGLALIALGALGSSSAAQEDGFRPLFDGETLDGWRGDMRYWRVEDGAITGETTPENPGRRNTFLVWRRGELDDFELRLRYRLAAGNSGIQYRSVDLGDHDVKGYQADIGVGGALSGDNYHEHGRGLLARRGERVDVTDGRGKREVVGRVGDAAELTAAIRDGEWNEYRILARGRHLVHEINGTVMTEVTDNGRRDYRDRGILALQIHSGPPMKVQFKDIRLKRLPLTDGRRKIVFVAGHKSHGYGAHENRAGCLLLARWLDEHEPRVLATVYDQGWPADPSAFDNCNAIVLYMNGGGGHPVLRHLGEIGERMADGVGLACLHYAVEAPKGRPGELFLQWIGGYFETHWSVNPTWEAKFTAIPSHPVTRGVAPFTLHDEWYYHMRFRPDMRGVTPVLTAVPPDHTRKRRDGPHSNNPTVRARVGEPEHVAWVCERPGGRGRGFGLTGGHFHWSWGHDQLRTLVLNALLWIAGLEVPADGLRTRSPTPEELLANQDYPARKNRDAAWIRERLDAWNR